MTAPHLLPCAPLLILRVFARVAQATLTEESELMRVRSEFRLFFNYRVDMCALSPHSFLTHSRHTPQGGLVEGIRARYGLGFLRYVEATH